MEVIAHLPSDKAETKPASYHSVSDNIRRSESKITATITENERFLSSVPSANDILDSFLGLSASTYGYPSL